MRARTSEAAPRGTGHADGSRHGWVGAVGAQALWHLSPSRRPLVPGRGGRAPIISTRAAAPWPSSGSPVALLLASQGPHPPGYTLHRALRPAAGADGGGG